MKFFTGYLLADHVLAKSSCRREFAPGEIIFSEGAAATGLFVVASGKVGIIKTTANGESRVAEIGPGGIFGEMGLISSDGVRSASARASEPTVVIEVRNNPIELLKEVGDSHATVALLKRVVCVLGDWIRARNERIAAAGGAEPSPEVPNQTDVENSLEVVRQNLPRGFLHLFTSKQKLDDGHYLCRQGEKSRGFSFIHQGTLELLRSEAPDGEEHRIGLLRGPTVAGELGYFSGQPRLASLRARGEVIHTYFSGYDFAETEKSDPDKAVEILLAVARSIVDLVRGGNQAGEFAELD